MLISLHLRTPQRGRIGASLVVKKEPEACALMLAGLAAVGFVARRRDNRSKKA